MATKNLKSNLQGRIKKVKTNNFLVPLFEAVSNSIHAIEELAKDKGSIEIQIIRNPRQTELGIDSEKAISGFKITDNGSGFSDENMASFEEVDSTYKEAKGGKGIGRISWLKFFETTDVSSTFRQSQNLLRREFRFTPNGIEDEKIMPLKADATFETIVSLDPIKTQWEKNSRKSLEDIGICLIEHFISWLVTDSMPQVLIKDGAAKLNLKSKYDQTIGKNQIVEKIQLKGKSFTVTGFKNYVSNSTHTIFLCGHKRVADFYHLAKRDRFFNRQFTDENLRKYSYSLFVESDYLDTLVNDDRDGFRFPEDGSLSSAVEGDISKAEILNSATDVVKKHLSKEIEEKKNSNSETVKAYVYESAPQYRSVIHNNLEAIANIHDSEPEKIDIELRRLQFEEEVRTREEISALLKEAEKSDAKDKDEWNKKATEVISKLSESGKASLASYIVQRKMILDLLKRKLEISGDKYAKEAAIHELIFPMRNTSDEVTHEQQNLWIVDERLSYHYYLASDKKLSSIPDEDIKSGKEPDIIVFNRPIALNDRPDTEKIESIVILEFKRPGESAVKGDKNPVDQMLDYMDIIISQKAKARTGRPLNITQGTHFYGYAICELDQDLKKVLGRLQMKSTPDGRGMFGYFPEHNAYIEVISYDKMLDDAFKRNRILFEKLHIPK